MDAYNFDDQHNTNETEPVMREPELLYPLFVMAFSRLAVGSSLNINKHWGLFLQKIAPNSKLKIQAEGDVCHANPGKNGTTRVDHKMYYKPAMSRHFKDQWRVHNATVTMSDFIRCCREAGRDREFSRLGGICQLYVQEVLDIMVRDNLIPVESRNAFINKHGTIFTGTSGEVINKAFHTFRQHQNS